MNDIPHLVFALLAGVGLGAMFFGGLWWTVRKSLGCPSPARWISGSLLLRMSAALSGFYFVGHEHWAYLAACLLGFLFARLAVTWLTATSQEHLPCSSQKASHAP